jgi:phospholipase D1/2
MDRKTFHLAEGRTCWRIGTANRAAVLRDGNAFFTALTSSFLKARRYVLIAGWEFDPRVRLQWTGERRRWRLSRIFRRMIENNPHLEIYLLMWDYSVIYTMERDPLSSLRLGLPPHPRIHYHADDEHPIGGSHHQKIVVVDGEVAFSGGLDLTKRRWDTPEHQPHQPLRTDPSGVTYPPFHDVQMVIEGDIVDSMTELFCDRWLKATGLSLSFPRSIGQDCWPDPVAPQFTSVPVGISRTAPEYKGSSGIREVKTLFLESIARAREYIYLEHQFFTSTVIRDAIIRRLHDKEGPQIVIVLSKRSMGWIEEVTLDQVRDGILLELYKEDRHGRLGVFYPYIKGLNGACIKVHSKVCIVDDELLRVGSANLTNRSMGMDTECDLSIEAHSDERIRRGIALVRDTLISEHMGNTPEEVAARDGGLSLLGYLQRERNGSRRLVSFRPDVEQRRSEILLDQEIFDPEHPLMLDGLMDDLTPPPREHIGRGRLLRLGIVLFFMSAVALVWRMTPLSEYVRVETFTQWTNAVTIHAALVPFIVLLIYIVGGLIMFPVTILIAATAAMFDLVPSILYAYLGSLSSAIITYLIGARLGRRKVGELTGSWLDRLSRRLQDQGLFTVTVMRMLPLAPFTVVNMVAGAMHIRFRHYVLGTFFGMTPGILAIAVFTERLLSFVRTPDVLSFLVLIGVAGVMILAGVWVKKRLSTVHE